VGILLGVLLVLHGIAHLVGFVVPWNLLNVEDVEYKTTLLSGRWDVGDLGIRLVGSLWLAGAAAFIATGAALLAGAAWWKTAAFYTSFGSLALSVLGWPDSRIGVAINVLLLGYLQFGGTLGMLQA
jgi:hypothetical protein